MNIKEKANYIFQSSPYTLGDLSIIAVNNNLETIEQAVEYIFNRIIHFVNPLNNYIN